jgi:uncharacterized protein YidB (DUF937 family)
LKVLKLLIMLENLLKLVKENAGDAIINNPAIPNVQNDAAIETATNSIFKALQGSIKSGGLNSIKDLFQSGSNIAGNPVMNNLSSNVGGDLMAKFGLDKGAAANIVSSLLPKVMGQLVNKTNDPNDNSFDLDGIIGALSGGKGKTGGILGTLGNLFKR